MPPLMSTTLSILLAKYSFMLSAPIVLAATMLKFLKGEFVFCASFFAGVFASFLVGILVIKFLLKYLEKGSFKGFAIYRVLLAVALIVVYIVRI